MGWLERWALRRVAKGAGLEAETLVGMISGSSLSGSRKRRTTQAMLAAWSTSPWFRGVVERVSFAAAVVPWRLYAVKAEPGSREFKAGKSYVRHRALQFGESYEVRSKLLRGLDAAGRVEEITDHKLFDVLQNPNPMLTGVDMRLLTFASITVVGEIGWAIARGNLGAPEEIWPVPSNWITRTPSADYDFYDVQMNNTVRRFSRDEFILFKNPSIANPYGRGSGIGMALADELETDEYIAKFQNTWFINRGKPDLIFTVKPSSTGEGPSTDELKIAREKFENQYRDVRRGGRSFWTRGDIDIKELSTKFVDLDLTEQRGWIKDLVRQVIGCPPEVMGDIESSNRATITEALAILGILSTTPQLERMRAQLQMSFVPMFDDRLALGFHSPVPEDREFKLKAIQAAPWSVEVGEMRSLQGLEDRGDADRVHYVPMNLLQIPAPPKAGEPARSGETRSLQAKADDDGVKMTDEGIEQVSRAAADIHIAKQVRPLFSEELKDWADEVLEEMGLEPSFDLLNPIVIVHLESVAAERVTLVGETTREAIRSELVVGVSEGEGIKKLARRIRGVFAEASRSRAVMIARTEVVRSANFGTWAAYKQSGVVEQRQWVSTPDGRTRHPHQILDGDVVGIDEPFVYDGHEAMHPGGFGVARLDINCRCTTIAVIGEPKGADYRRQAWKQFDNRLIPWENSTAAAYRRGFDAQQTAVLAALERLAA